MADKGIKPEFFNSLEVYAGLMERTLPRYLFNAFRHGLFGEGVEFKKRFRENLNSRFKIKKSKVGNLFKVYTAGKNLGELELGVFTIWNAAETYEAGGTIAASGGYWLLVAITPKAYTAGGRIKRSWRNAATGKFAPDKLEDLVAVPVNGKSGKMFMLFKGEGRYGNPSNSAGFKGNRAENYRKMAIEPWFLMIKMTKRMPLLRFMADFMTFVAQSGGLDKALDRSLEAAERQIGK